MQEGKICFEKLGLDRHERKGTLYYVGQIGKIRNG